jgi:hypothetical protein
MLFPGHRGLGIAPNIEPPVVKVVFHPTFHPQAYACFERTDRTVQAGLFGSDSGTPAGLFDGISIHRIRPLNVQTMQPITPTITFPAKTASRLLLLKFRRAEGIPNRPLDICSNVPFRNLARTNDRQARPLNDLVSAVLVHAADHFP